MDANNLGLSRLRSTTWHFAILIPAQNEEALLPRCLRSIAKARAKLPPAVTTDLVVVSDSSTDETLRIARAYVQRRSAVLQTGASCVGSARALAARVALERYAGPLNRCWLANTDADCEVPETWLADQLHIAQQDYMAVAGVVDVNDFSEHLPMVERRFRLSYEIRSDGTHPHVHGANLGVRADAYVAAGGWKSLVTAEDHDLWVRLRNTGASQVSDARLQVITSGRRVGRAPLGFAQGLAAHNEPVSA